MLMWDTETGEPYIAHVVFVSPNESRDHIMFKGVRLFPEDDKV